MNVFDDLKHNGVDLTAHRSIVTTISSRIQRFHSEAEPFRIYHGSTNSTRKSQHTATNTVDTSKLTNVLHVDKVKCLAYVESNVPMDKLASETLKHGLIAPVVMEFPGITVGGGFQGTSGESSSFRHGFFDRTIQAAEMVLANGEVVVASAKAHPDLFRGAASSFGTLGVTTLLVLELVEAKKYVSLTYVTVRSMAEAVDLVRKEEKNESLDYIDGMLFAKDHGVICLGKLTDNIDPGANLQTFTKPWDPWFFLNAKKLSAYRHSWTETIPITDYLFRYDRGAFWVGIYAFQYFITPFNRITRRLLDYFMHTRVMYHALHKSGHAERYIIQDVAIPYDRTTEFLDYLDIEFGHYPLWLCPLRLRGKSPESAHGLLAEDKGTSPSTSTSSEPEMMMNFGVWGPGPTNRLEFIVWNRQFERKVNALGGRKWLYAHAYYTEDEFWSIYDRKSYDALRQKYHATRLPTIFDKVKVDYAAEEQAIQGSWWLWFLAIFWSIWPLSGFYGVFQTLISRDYLLSGPAVKPNRQPHKRE